MELTSPVFQTNAPLPVAYTCQGEGINPPLTISGVPNDAKSLALLMHDSDAIGGKDFLHWSVWNIAPDVTSIAEDSVPTGALQGTNDYSSSTYGPACPPAGSGLHRYIFDVYALDTILNLPGGASRHELEAAMQSHTLAKAQLAGTVSA